ncbi:hypothetical protein GCM10023192_31910 [Amycolatopsis samaneae]
MFGNVVQIGHLHGDAHFHAGPGHGRKPDTGEIADLLAESLLDEWTKTAGNRDLLSAKAIPIRWTPAPDATEARISAAVEAGAFRPVPGGSPIENAEELGEACAEGLFSVYGRLPSGRLILVGGPGCGKSSAAILLLIEILDHRRGLPADRRREVPVPVILSMHDWDPDEVNVETWLATRIADRLGTSRFRRRRRRQATALLRENRIAVFLDGLDELKATARSAAVEKLTRHAGFRWVLLSRPENYTAAVSGGALLCALTLTPRPLERDEVTSYLKQFEPATRNDGWHELLARIERPDGALADVITTPLSAGLLAAVSVDEDVIEGVLRGSFPDQETLVRYLYADLVRVRCRSDGRHSHDVVHRTLALIARELGPRTTEFAWWDLPALGVRSRLVRAVLSVLTGSVVGALLGIGWAVLYWLAYDVLYGESIGLVTVLPDGIGYGLSFGAAGAFLIELSRPGRPPRSSGSRWRKLLSPDLPVLRVAAAVVAGAAAVLVRGGDIGLAGGLTVAALVAVLSGLAAHRTNTSAKSPGAAWHLDLRSAIGSGLVFGVVVGAVVGAAMVVFRSAVPTWLVVGPVLGLPLGLGAGLMHSSVWNTTIAQAYLAVRHGTPPRLIALLEDARRNLLLRMAGPYYEFPHATFRDWIATTTPPASARDIRRVLATVCAGRPHRNVPVELLRDRLVFETIQVTRARVPDVCGMDVENLDLRPEDEHARVGSAGLVRLDDPRYLILLKRYLDRNGYRSGPLFRDEAGGRLSPEVVHDRWRDYCRRASIDIDLRGLRRRAR